MPGIGILDPRTLGSKLFAWYHPGTAGVVGVADGVAVAQWNDASDNQRHIVQGTGANQPLVKTGANGLNGFPVVLFDGVNDEMFIATAGAAVRAYSLLVVAKNTLADDGGFHDALTFNQQDARISLDWQTTNQFGLIDAGATDSAAAYAGDTSLFHVFSGIFRPVGGFTVLGMDGIHTPFTGVAGTSSNRDIRLGSGNATRFWGGPIAEAIIILDDLSTVQLREWEHSLARKYNLISQFKLNG